MRTTVAISDPLLENAKLRAAQRGVTLSELVEEGLAMVIAATDQAKKAPPFVLKTAGGHLVDPSIDLDRTSAILDEEDIAHFLEVSRRNAKR